MCALIAWSDKYFKGGTSTVNDTRNDGWQPLKGLKIIDFSMLLPGPLATLIMADLGAEVIKVEPPGGDYARHMKSFLFEGSNRNKSSIVVDLKAPDAKDIIKRLAEYGDVAIEGFRPGVADRLGIGPDQLQAINPALIYCSLSGFGQTGPISTKAGHDLAYIAMGGGLAQKGQLRQAPSRSSLPVADIAGGSFAAISILAAMHARKPDEKGAVLDISLYESVLYSSAIRFGFETSAEENNHLYPANDLFTCGDGRQIALTIVEVKFWDNFVRVTKDIQPEFGHDDFASEEGRLVNADRLMALLDDLFASKPAAHWIEFLDPADVPATICVTNQETVTSEHALHRAMHMKSGETTVMPFPVIASGQHVTSKQTTAPARSIDAARILDKLGYSADQISDFAARSIVEVPET
jgi:crotonobetainyl-CoA:carnitine CoA-transferase CaiB-like acyl-CoA transferase